SQIGSGAVVSLEADFAPESISALLALLAAGAISVPIGPASASRARELRTLAQAEHRVVVEPGGVTIEAAGARADHPLYAQRPEGICRTIARHRVEVLPASPSFLTLLLLSEAHRRHDLSSLRYITYGAEVMPQSTLARLALEFPHVRLLQKYGLTELGTLRSH